MGEIISVSTLVRIGLVCVGIFAMLALLTHFDRKNARQFSDHLGVMEREPLALAIYLGARILAVAILLGMLFGCTPANAAVFPKTYDRDIQSAVKTYWPDYPDWLFWKAQLFQESRLDPLASSSVGAVGLAQFMPATWSDISKALGFGIVPRSLAQPAIDGGAYYMARLRHGWHHDKQQLAQASYNAGTGNILKAQKRCGEAPLWIDIRLCIADVTGPDNAKQTIGYVTSIAKWRAAMALGE